MHIIGLTGGVACGKSTVAALLAKRGAVVFDADKIGHLVLDEPAVRDALVAHWGASILDDAGHISRPAVAQRVFAGTGEADDDRQFLEQVVHPRIRARIEDEIRRLPDASVPAVVVDAALLVESGWNDVCNLVVMVDCPEDERRRRAVARGWTADEFARRQASQMPIDEKRRWATYLVDNSAGLPELAAAVDRFWAAAVDGK